jgi:GNAT superfamily N-acetyltransferase
MLTIEQVSTPSDIAAVGDLIREFTEWAISLEPTTKDAPTFQNLEAELATLPGAYAPPTGCLLLARNDDHPVGCIAFLARGNDVVEVKRMYVRAESRGLKVGQKLLARLIEQARNQNATQIILDSYYTMTSAHKIYRAAGFKDIPAPADFPAVFVDKVVFMEMNIDQSGRG